MADIKQATVDPQKLDNHYLEAARTLRRETNRQVEDARKVEEDRRKKFKDQKFQTYLELCKFLRPFNGQLLGGGNIVKVDESLGADTGTINVNEVHQGTHNVLLYLIEVRITHKGVVIHYRDNSSNSGVCDTVDELMSVLVDRCFSQRLQVQ